ncbi:MAG: hypothetical protein JWO80_5390, partial [Bryobacterales bacterium]|nr:hypothetical protein [Bryobacterales bacterium]
DEDLAYEVERELFERGCFVAVIRGDQDANVLMDVGFIAVRVNPDSQAASAEEILKDLEDRGVIRQRAQFSGGEGI